MRFYYIITFFLKHFAETKNVVTWNFLLMFVLLSKLDTLNKKPIGTTTLSNDLLCKNG